ncbi:MAG: Rrf2 family transcriptional regulator [Pseudomonadota bacterium]
MKIGKGVEWAAHACALLAAVPEGGALAGEALAEFLGVPPAYLAKQLQALSRAGIVSARRGAAGGYRLAQSPDALSLWDITAAIEGTAPSFRCTEVRRSGPCGASPAECSAPCPIAAAFRRAEAGYRRALSAVRLTDIVTDVARNASAARKRRIRAWIDHNAALPA